MGVEPVVFFLAEPDGPGDVGAGLVGVELDCLPPAGHGGVLGIGGGDGVDELANDFLLGVTPRAVPDRVDGDVGRQDGAHVVLQLDELGRALVLLGGSEDEFGGVGFLVGPWAPGGDRCGEEDQGGCGEGEE